jgi:hypothetical protein
MPSLVSCALRISEERMVQMMMTRCLNCGAERNTDVCEACGLGSSAAEFSLRKKLLNRTGMFLLGSIAFVVAAGRYPALDLDGILIFVGVAFFLTLGLAIWVERRALRHGDVEMIKRIYYGLIPIPWLLGALLLGNGALDRAQPRVEEARVVGKFWMPGSVATRRLVVTSWREGRTFERVAVDRSDFDRVAPGDTVYIRVGSGLIGIPWIAGVSCH